MKVKTLMIITFSFITLGTIAEGYNLAYHQHMAQTACENKHNIENVNNKGFECKKDQQSI